MKKSKNKMNTAKFIPNSAVKHDVANIKNKADNFKADIKSIKDDLKSIKATLAVLVASEKHEDKVHADILKAIKAVHAELDKHAKEATKHYKHKH